MPDSLKARQPSIPAEVASEAIHRDLHYEIVSNRTVPFTQQLAIEILELPTFEGERNVNGNWVSHLVGEAKRGAWIQEQASVITCFCEYDKKIRRLNGQHTCWMRFELPEKWHERMGIEIRHIRYSVKTEEDLRKLYTIIDRNKARTSSQVICARLVGIDSLPGISPSCIHALAKGYRVYLGKESISPDKLSDQMSTQDSKLICKVAGYMGEKGILNESFMRRAPVIGALLATFGASPDIAPTFWDRVIDGLNITSNRDPKKKLREYLMQIVIKKHGDSLPDQKRVTSEEVYRACILAWNAFRRNDELAYLKPVGLKRRPAIR